MMGMFFFNIMITILQQQQQQQQKPSYNNGQSDQLTMCLLGPKVLFFYVK